MGDFDERIVVAGGGTGGHVNPGLAIADELRRRRRDRTVLFIGTRSGLESRLVPAAGYRLETVRASGLVGVGPTALLRGLARLPLGVADGLAILRRFRPGLVLGVGGYASGPALLAAVLRRLPTMIHEQNRWPGVTNRALGPLVDRIAVSFEGTAGHIGRRGVVTGNPVRPGFAAVPPWGPRPGRPRVLIFGGSRGARALNEAMMEALPRLRDSPGRPVLRHQTGPADHERVRRAYVESGIRDAVVEPYIDDMVAALAEADLVVCRAGASTLAELAAAGRASLLVPFPHAAHDHQRRNALGFVEAGAARILEQRELNGDRLAREILTLSADAGLLAGLSARARDRARPEAASRIADMAEALLGEARP